MKNYYSRTSKTDEGIKYELLEEHLAKTANLCRDYLEDINCSNIGYTLGFFHDLGKRTEYFQDVLFGRRTGINHAFAGANIFNSYFLNAKNNNSLSQVMLAHHTGLNKYDSYENIIGKKDVNNKLCSVSNEEELLNIVKYTKNNFPLNVTDVKKEYIDFFNINKNDSIYLNNIRYMLKHRFLLSALVDADYSSSASFSDVNYLENYTGEKLLPDILLKKLNSYKDNLAKNSSSNKDLNLLRDTVYNNCVEKAQNSDNKHKNYTLTAPVGAGKTLATIAFALTYAKKYDTKRLIFVLPLLTLTEQTTEIYKEIFGENIVFEDNSIVEYTDYNKDIVSRWDAPIIVTTTVKFCETLFKQNTSDLRKLHNIINSLVVFDEIQMLNNEIVDATVNSIKVLNEDFNVTTLFCSATQPAFEFRQNSYWNPEEIITNPDFLFEIYNKNKKMEVVWDIDELKTVENICELVLSEKGSTAVILNTKKDSLRIYNELKNKTDAPLFYLSTNMCVYHRQNITKKIAECLKNNEKCIVVSTSCIETGVDLDFDNMYRAMAPFTALIQASGRVNRNNTKKNSKFYIFNLENGKYPDRIHYEKAKDDTVTLFKQKKKLNLYNLSDIKDYYKKLYKFKNNGNDKNSLVNAVNSKDYIEVEKTYKLIDNQGIMLIVPYQDKIDLYNEIYNDLVSNDFCITKQIIKKANSLTVNLYNTKDIINSKELHIKSFIDNEENFSSSGWFILLNQDNYSDTGVNFSLDNFIF